ncbi:MAG TPA: hypothetical protein PLU94_01785 [Methanoregulaceae archaeon]|nr:hypothetical protein [Methanoregulaceae archaeon]
MRKSSIYQRRGVGGTVREKRADAAGDEEPTCRRLSPRREQSEQ